MKTTTAVRRGLSLHSLAVAARRVRRRRRRGVADTTTPAPRTTGAAPTTVATTVGAPTSPPTARPPPRSPPDPVMPLTGLPVTDAATREPAGAGGQDRQPRRRPARRAASTRPTSCSRRSSRSITRFAAVFQSQDADPVGPIRSGRTQDIDLLGSFNQPLFAWSGGNANVTAAIDDSDLVDLSAVAAPATTAASSATTRPRGSAQPVRATRATLYALAPPDAGPPPQQFTVPRRRARRSTASRRRASTCEMDGVDVNWTWDADTGLLPALAAAASRTTTPSVGQVTQRQRRRARGRLPAEPGRRAQPRGADRRHRRGVRVHRRRAWSSGTWTRADRLRAVPR